MKWSNLLFVLLFLGSDLNLCASCMSCSKSFGLQVELKNGDVRHGYFLWNEEVLPIIKLIENVNYALLGKGVMEENVAAKKKITLYVDFETISFPIKDLVAKQEDVIVIPLENIKSISLDAALNKRVDTSALNVLPAADILELQRKPRYVFSVGILGEDISVAYYVATSSALEPLEFLSHIFASEYRSLSYDGEALSVSEYDLGRYALNCTGKISRSKSRCENFRTRWDRFQEEYWNSESKDDKTRNALLTKNGFKPWKESDFRQHGIIVYREVLPD